MCCWWRGVVEEFFHYIDLNLPKKQTSFEYITWKCVQEDHKFIRVISIVEIQAFNYIGHMLTRIFNGCCTGCNDISCFQQQHQWKKVRVKYACQSTTYVIKKDFRQSHKERLTTHYSLLGREITCGVTEEKHGWTWHGAETFMSSR